MPVEEVNPASQASLQSYSEPRVFRPEHIESSLTRVLEHQSAKIPSDYFLMAAMLTMCASAFYEYRNNERASRFLGMWVAPMLIMGVYNKLVKTLGPT